ncbi:choice-of-anchor B domain [Fusarium albosuccineum]|uniref:Choice-of-anchor B domain n=1 Tax=Fusarium albosuccineum TaxID=1237068 RepID=A0A8H4PIZ5_9HYPO|nr:choice-of-anchor B domain [Fusarium albosuccineum]
MKLSAFLTTAALATMGAADDGKMKMDEMMALKTAQWDRAEARGLFGGSKLYKKLTSFQPCIKGKSGRGPGKESYSCNNVNMHGFLSHEDLGSTTFRGNDVWGWTSKTGREFGIVGQTDGVGFVEITKSGSLVYLGRLDTQTTATSWRDIKVIGDHAYIGAESEGHGLQIFDLKKLLKVSPRRPKVFSKETDLTALFTGFGSSHNIVAHEEVNMIYAVGGRTGPNSRNTTCAGGMFMVDVSDPANPTSPGCVPQDGYVHDAQCVIYKGPTKKYQGKEICFNYNEDTLTIMDMTDKSDPVVISRTPYEGNEYTHQGWLIDDTMEYLLLDDELDEMRSAVPGANGHTTTFIFNVANLEKPVNTGYYQSPAKSIDHNQYVVKGLTYQSNYGSGLRIVDVSGVHKDPTGGNFEEVGFFDVHPEDDDVGGVVEFLGTWSVYPYFRSGYILLNSIERGIFSLKYTGRKAKY